MVDNTQEYGFRWSRSKNSHSCPPVFRQLVASGATFDVTGGIQNAALRPGDVVQRLSDGTVTLCDGTETTATSPYGVVMGIKHYFDAATLSRTFASTLPSGIVWGTIQERRTEVLVTPIDAGIWEVDVDENTTITTLAGYQAIVGENIQMVNTGPVVGSNAKLEVRPNLDISGHATTATFFFRIEDVAQIATNQDPSGLNYKLLVKSNISQHPETTALGV